MLPGYVSHARRLTAAGYKCGALMKGIPMDDRDYFEPDPNSEEEQYRRRYLAPVRRLALRENARRTSRRYAVAVGLLAVIVFVWYWLAL